MPTTPQTVTGRLRPELGEQLMWALIHKKTAAVFLGLIFLIVVVAVVAYVSLMSCPGFFRRSYHTIVLGDKNYVEGRFRVQGHGTSLLSSGRLAGFTTLRSSDCVNVVVWAEDLGSPGKPEKKSKRELGERPK